MKREYVNKAIKWTLQNVKHLDASDMSLIEKATDDRHLCLLQGQSPPDHTIHPYDEDCVAFDECNLKKHGCNGKSCRFYIDRR